MRTQFQIVPFIIFLLCLCTTKVQADSGWSSFEGRGHVMIDITKLDLSDLNSHLRSHGYAELSENNLSIGFGGYGIRKNNLIIDGYAAYMIPDGSSKSGYESSISGIIGTYNVGYLLYKNEHFRLFPLFGFSFGSLKLSVKETKKRDFDDVLYNQNESSIETDPFIALNIAAECKWIIWKKTDGDKDRHRGISLRVGYRRDMGNKRWYTKDGPKIEFSGPYITMTFGGGYTKI